VILGFRPEDVEDAALAGERRGCTLDVVPAIREDMGAEVYVHFSLGVEPVRRRELAEALTPEEPEGAQRAAARSGSPFVARLGRMTGAREREPLRVTVDTDRVYFFDPESGEGVYDGG
jgi:multiple sugar transport system ATP-binding protein